MTLNLAKTPQWKIDNWMPGIGAAFLAAIGAAIGAFLGHFLSRYSDRWFSRAAKLESRRDDICSEIVLLDSNSKCDTRYVRDRHGTDIQTAYA